MQKQIHPFYYRILKILLRQKIISATDSILVVCGGIQDQATLDEAGLHNLTVTSIIPGSNMKGIINYQQEDAQSLSYVDNSFDTVIVHAGLHHLPQPHRGLSEMYRVARKSVIMIEGQDSWFSELMKIFFGKGIEYEHDAVNPITKTGGLNNGPIPNYVYRWTRREFEKTIRSCDPTIQPAFRFYSQFQYHKCFTNNNTSISRNPFIKLFGKRVASSIFSFVEIVLNTCLPSAGNLLCCIAIKP